LDDRALCRSREIQLTQEEQTVVAAHSGTNGLQQIAGIGPGLPARSRVTVLIEGESRTGHTHFPFRTVRIGFPFENFYQYMKKRPTQSIR